MRRSRPLDLRPSCLVAALLLLAGCAAEQAQSPPAEPKPPVEARAAVDRAVATTGDLITYRVTVEHDAGYEVEVPEPGAEIAGFRIVDVGREEPKERAGRITVERWYRLRADLVGSYVLPPVTVEYRRTGAAGEGEAATGTVQTSAIFVEVASVLPEGGDATDIRDIKPLRKSPSRVPWGWIVGGALGLAAIAAAVVLLRRRHAAVAPPQPPHELAFRALDALRGADFDDPAAVRRFYFAISEVVRAYVEGRFGLNATDLTTEEIVVGLEGLPGLPPDPERELETFLSHTDQVKFAAHRPSEEEIRGTYERALGFVESTRPVEQAGQAEQGVAA